MSAPQFPPPDLRYDENHRIMNRLEVETTSTKSLTISFPTYYPDSKSLDTFNLLDTKSRSSSPHKSQQQQQQQQQAQQSMNYNSIPKRFSQFITDQQNPYMSQKQSGISPNLEPLRDISNSMGSQATIFSTRQDMENNQTISSFKMKRSKTRWLKRNSKSSSVQLTRQSSFNSGSIKRTRAIKIKQGSKWYRMKLALKKLVSKLTYFIVPNKRKPSMKRKSSLKRGRTLIRKQRLNPQNKDIRNLISSPITNSNLGKEPVFKVNKMENLKQQQRVQSQQSELIEKNRQLSNYIKDQEKEFEKSHLPIALKENRSEFESLAPSVPPHVDTSFQQEQQKQQKRQQIELHHLWQSYLRFVLFKRIQLRHEITLFQNYLIENTTPTFEPVHDKESVVTSVDDIESTSSNYSSMESKSVVSANEEDEFSNKVLHRRSMLGEMLEYSSSEDEEDENEVEELSSNSNSAISKQYGTVKYHKGRPMKKSFGVSHSLSELSTT